MKYTLDNLEIVGKQYLKGVGGYDGTNTDSSKDVAAVFPNMVSVKYNELKSLRDGSNLVPGQQYRITDYVTTTSQERTQSAGHQFDIIVTATSNNTLSEIAGACLHDGDTYFSEAGAKLEAWKIWYCLDNDTNRFAWARSVDSEPDAYKAEFVSIYWNDPVNGENYDGKIGNDKIYDWGTEYDPQLEEDNIVFYKSDESIYIEDGSADYGDKYFYRGVITVDGVEYDNWQKWDVTHESWCFEESRGSQYALTERIVFDGKVIWSGKFGAGVIYRMIDEWGNDCPYDFKNIMFKKWLYADGGGITTEDNADYDEYCYTFSWQDQDYGIMDASVVGNNGYVTAEYGENKGVYGNVIGVWIDGVNEYPCQQLNSIVFLSTYMSDYGNYNGCYSNTFGENCYNNIFNSDCYSNTFDGDCYNNTFDYDFHDNTFDSGCYNNTFGNYCHDNTFGKYCYRNRFGNSCESNTFDGYCYDNTFGNYCYSNRFGNNCRDNTFGNSCYNNTFGSSCHKNTFGSSCYRNIFVSGCYNNTFGHSCDNNTFDGDCYNNTFGSSCYKNTFGDSCYNNTFDYDCYNNTFGSDCYNNTFGNGCDNNTFGNSCECNTFGNSCSHIKFGDSSSTPKSYYRYIIFDNGNSYIYLNSTTSKGSSKYYQNVRIGLGVNNGKSYKTITDSNVNQPYETWYRPTNSQTKNI